MSNKEKAWKEKLKTDSDFAFANKKNHTPHAYIDIAGGLIEGTLLTQILYWCGDDKSEHGKLTIFRDGHYWLAKGRDDWYEEVRVTPRQYDTAISKLKGEVKEKGKIVRIDETKKLVEVKVFKFRGVPTTHIRPIYENINLAIEEWKNNLTQSMSMDITEEKQFDDISDSQNGDLRKLQNREMEITDMQDDIQIYNIYNTDTELTNKDYNTENTKVDTLSKDNAKADTAFLRKSLPAPKKKKTKSELKELESDMIRRFYNVGKQYDTSKLAFENILKAFCRYLDRYTERTNKVHPILKDETLEKIFVTLATISDTEYSHFDNVADYEPDSNGISYLDEMVDEHFKAEHGDSTDWHISHFARSEYLEKMAQHIVDY